PARLPPQPLKKPLAQKATPLPESTLLLKRSASSDLLPLIRIYPRTPFAASPLPLSSPHALPRSAPPPARCRTQRSLPALRPGHGIRQTGPAQRGPRRVPRTPPPPPRLRPRTFHGRPHCRAIRRSRARPLLLSLRHRRRPENRRHPCRRRNLLRLDGYRIN